MKTPFNIYYINYPKVYEIKMMFSNTILVAKDIEKKREGNADTEIGIKMGLGFLNVFNGKGSGKIHAEGSASKKVLETLEIKTTKSIILNDVIEASTEIFDFNENIDEGKLVLINDVKLSLENEV